MKLNSKVKQVKYKFNFQDQAKRREQGKHILEKKDKYPRVHVLSTSAWTATMVCSNSTAASRTPCQKPAFNNSILGTPMFA